LSLCVGITCYPTYGGSGIIATEVGLALARRGHRVHFIATDLPKRLDPSHPNVEFHRVEAADYPVFPSVPYSLALASRMVAVHRDVGLDLLHVHYAVPHATSGWMAREVLGDDAPKLITTLHGTDITLVGDDDAYLPITRHSIAKSDAVTAPSAFLRDETWSRFDLDTPIAVIPNFVHHERWHPPTRTERTEVEAVFGSSIGGDRVVVHTSNFRPVKQVDQVVQAFATASQGLSARLVLIGEGPERPAIEALVTRLGLDDRVRFAGNYRRIPSLLRECDAFLLPSRTESFGLAGLEALSSGVPVVASDVGGLPEVVRHGQTGFLAPLDDVDALAAHTRVLLTDSALRTRMGEAARADVLERYRIDPMIDRYLELYRDTLAR